MAGPHSVWRPSCPAAQALRVALVSAALTTASAYQCTCSEYRNQAVRGAANYCQKYEGGRARSETVKYDGVAGQAVARCETVKYHGATRLATKR